MASPGQVLKNAAQQVALRGILAVERLQTGVSFLPMGDEFAADPYPTYRRLRERDPIHRSRLIGGWVLTRHADISTALRDGRFIADDRKSRDYDKNRTAAIKNGLMGEDESDEVSMLRSDPPDHTRLRGLVSRAFTPRTVESLRGRVEQIVSEHLDAVAGQGGMDVIAALAYPLPVIIIAEMLGIPVEDHARFKAWSDDIVRGMGMSSVEDGRVAYRGRRELRAYLEGVASARRRDPREDLLSALLAAEEDGAKLSTDELYQTCELLLVAGHETTTNLIGNGLLALLRNPDQLDLLRRDPSLIEHGTEELLRYDGPVQATTRFTLEDVELGGTTIRAGDNVAIMLGAANRDPAVFTDPDRLDVTREDLHHFSFGHGIHYCLGSPLARLEAPIAFRQIFERFPRLTLDETVRPQWNGHVILRGLRQLAVRF